jgi:hypothetical protein
MYTVKTFWRWLLEVDNLQNLTLRYTGKSASLRNGNPLYVADPDFTALFQTSVLEQNPIAAALRIEHGLQKHSIDPLRPVAVVGWTTKMDYDDMVLKHYKNWHSVIDLHPHLPVVVVNPIPFSTTRPSAQTPPIWK